MQHVVLALQRNWAVRFNFRRALGCGGRNPLDGLVLVSSRSGNFHQSMDKLFMCASHLNLLYLKVVNYRESIFLFTVII